MSWADDRVFFWRRAMEDRFEDCAHRLMTGYRLPLPESSIRSCAARALREMRLRRGATVRSSKKRAWDAGLFFRALDDMRNAVAKRKYLPCDKCNTPAKDWAECAVGDCRRAFRRCSTHGGEGECVRAVKAHQSKAHPLPEHLR
jgi:hypothetical protein